MKHTWKGLLASVGVCTVLTVGLPATHAFAYGDADNGSVGAIVSGLVVGGGACPVTAGDNLLINLPKKPVKPAQFALVGITGTWGGGTAVADVVPVPTALTPIFASVAAPTHPGVSAPSIQACTQLLDVSGVGIPIVNFATVAGAYGGPGVCLPSNTPASLSGLVTGWAIQAGVVAVTQLDINWALVCGSPARNADETALVAVVPAGSVALAVLVNGEPDIVVAAIGPVALLCDALEAVGNGALALCTGP